MTISQGPREGELTIDQLAARTGMTVRNVRAYSTRGLIPPPRLVGRTGYYGAEHVARLTLVREMLDQGYTLTAAERLLASAPSSGAQALGLYHSLMSPWDSEPEVLEPETLAAQARVPHDPAVVDRLVEMGLAERLEDGRLRLPNVGLLRAGLEVIGLGIPVEDVLALVPGLRQQAGAVADSFVELFRSTLWADFMAAGMPDKEWPRMQEKIEAIIPLAGQALVAAFQEAMRGAIERAMGEELGAAAAGHPAGA
ncbi:MAG TPA: MerR family transcriptional regulator [Oryzihumus sp.]|nr:MerR family transcriptional regulator [Oryzihumus sp.]